MTREEQDKLWAELSEDERKYHSEQYQKALKDTENFFAQEYMILMRGKYGKHNLQPSLN